MTNPTVLQPDQAERTRQNALIAGAIAIVFLLNCIFIAVDRRAFNYDDSWYGEHAFRMLDRLAHQGLAGAATFFANETFFGMKAPLIILPPQPLLLLFGRGDRVFLFTNALCLVAAGIYLAALVRMAAGPLAAAAAVVVFGTMPLTAYTTHQFFVENLLAAIVLMFIYHALRSEHFTNRPHSLLAGLAFGLGMLAKVTFPVFVVGVAAIVLVQTWQNHRSVAWLCAAIAAGAVGPLIAVLGYESWPRLTLKIGAIIAVAAMLPLGTARRRWVVHLAGATAIAGWVSLIWYRQNLRSVLGFAYSNSVGEISRDYGSATIMSWDAIVLFWHNNVNFGFGVTYALGLAACGVLACISLFKPAPLSPRPLSTRSMLLLLVAWVLPAALAFTLGRNRTTRFILPMLPALAVLFALLLNQLVQRLPRIGLAFCTLQIVAAIAVYLSLAFSGPELRIGPHREWILSGPMLTERGPAVRIRLKLAPIVHTAHDLTRRGDANPPVVRLLTDSVHVNQNSLAYEAARYSLPPIFAMTHGQTFAEVIMSANASDLLLYQEGGGEMVHYPGTTNPFMAEVRRALRDGGLPGWQPSSTPPIELADGSTIRFLVKTTDSQSR